MPWQWSEPLRLSRALLASLLLLCAPVALHAQIEVMESSILELQEAMASGGATSVSIAEAFLARIAAYDHSGPKLNAILRLNPMALEEAALADRERAAGVVRGPLHGIPVVVKESFDVAGLPTSAGSLAFAALYPPHDATQVRMLREAGAVILGKTSMDELALTFYGRASLSGQTLNPYSLSRSPGGSSGGTAVAVAASFAAVGWGTDTCGSLRVPASHTSLFALRTTMGLSSTEGIFPLSRSTDVVAPMARSVMDLAMALDATVGLPEGASSEALLGTTFVAALEGASLRGVRLGLLEVYLGEPPEARTGADVVLEALVEMQELGVEVFSLEIPELKELLEGTTVVYDEFRWDLEDYLAGIPGEHPGSLTDVIASGLVDESLIPMLNSLNRAEGRASPSYLAALYNREVLRTLILEVMEAYQLDAIAYPTVRGLPAHLDETPILPNCALSSGAGFPAMTIPAGYAEGLPVGIELLGRPLEDARLLAFAYAFEQATHHRRPPPALPPLSERGSLMSVTFRTVGELSEGSPEPGDESLVRIAFSWNPVTSQLGYDLRLIRMDPADMFAVVLTSVSPLGGRVVVRNLSPPGEVTGSGSFELTLRDRERLLAGELFVEVFAAGFPEGVARTRVVLP